MYRVSKLSKIVGKKEVLKDIEFSMENGERLGIVGLHSSGKTVLLEILAGVLKPTSGIVEYQYTNLYQQGATAIRSDISYVPSSSILYPYLTVEEYFELICNLKNIVHRKEIEEEIKNILERFRLFEIRQKKISKLTRTLKQKINVAQALIGNPKLIIMDEPTSLFEPTLSAEIKGIIKSISGEVSMVIASHALSEVTYVCDKIMVLDKGRIFANESKQNLNKNFYQRNILKVEIDGAEEEIRKALEDISEILKLNITRKENGHVGVMIELDKSVDIRKQVFQRLSNIHVPILDMTLEPITIEELFNKLNDTQKEVLGGKIIDIKTKRLTLGGKDE